MRKYLPKTRYNIVGPPSLPFCPGTHCSDWDSPSPMWLTDRRTGNIMGRLMPRRPSMSKGFESQLLGYQRQS